MSVKFQDKILANNIKTLILPNNVNAYIPLSDGSIHLSNFIDAIADGICSFLETNIIISVGVTPPATLIPLAPLQETLCSNLIYTLDMSLQGKPLIPLQDGSLHRKDIIDIIASGICTFFYKNIPLSYIITPPLNPAPPVPVTIAPLVPTVPFNSSELYNLFVTYSLSKNKNILMPLSNGQQQFLQILLNAIAIETTTHIYTMIPLNFKASIAGVLVPI